MTLKHPTKEQVEYDYHVLNLNFTQMGEKYGIPSSTFSRLVKKYEIASKPKITDLITKEILIDLYVNKKMTLDEISKKYEFKSRSPIANLLKKYKIEIRSNIESRKIFNEKNIKISKEQLEYDYFELRLNQDEIGRKYGYYDRQPIMRLFKRYGIKARNIKEVGQFNSERCEVGLYIPTKEELEKVYPKYTIKELSKIYNLSSIKITNLMKKYEIQINNYVNDIDNKKLKEEIYQFSIKELAVKYNTSTTEIKRRCGVIPEILYDVERLKTIFTLYDLQNQGFSKQLKLDDLNVFNSLISHTEKHSLQSDKISERVYRLLNNFEPNEIKTCRNCKCELKFYTIKSAYGNSSHGICRDCNMQTLGVSLPSQELFWKLYKLLGQPKNCNFSELNEEVNILINEEDKIKFEKYEKLNKHRYQIDFMLDNKIIEYDGEFFHSDEEKELIKDRFLMSKGYKILHVKNLEYYRDMENTIQKCLNFLKS